MTSITDEISAIHLLIEQGTYDKADTHINDILAELKDDDLHNLALLKNLEAFLAFRRRNLEKSISLFTEALVLFKQVEETSEKDLYGISYAFNGLGLAQYRYGDDQLAFQYLRKALEMRFELGDVDLIASTLNNVANILLEAGASNSALDYFAEALEILEKGISKSKNNSSIIAMIYTNIGNIHNQDGNFKEAYDYYQRAWQEIQKNWDAWIASGILYNLGNHAINQGELDKAADYLEKALQIQEKLEGANVVLGKSLCSISRLKLQKHELQTALELVERATGLLETENDTIRGDTYILQGWILWLLADRDYTLPLNYFTKALQVFETQENTHLNQIEALSFLSGVQTDMKLFSEAEQSLKKAQDLLEDIEDDERLLILLYIGYLAKGKGEFERAEKFFDQVTMESEDFFNIQVRAILMQADAYLLQFYQTKDENYYIQMESTIRSLDHAPYWTYYKTAHLFYRVLDAAMTFIRTEFEEAASLLADIIATAKEQHSEEVVRMADTLRAKSMAKEEEMLTQAYTNFLSSEIEIVSSYIKYLDQVFEPQPRETPL